MLASDPMISLLRIADIDPAHVAAAGGSVDKRYVHESLRIEGMDCPTCATVIQHGLGRLDGVLDAKGGYAAERLRLEYDSEKSSHRAVVHCIEALGYRVLKPEGHAGWWAKHRELVFNFIAGGLLLGGWLGGCRGRLTKCRLDYISPLMHSVAASPCTLRDAAQSLWAKRFDIDALMLVAAFGGAALGDWAEGALLLFLFSAGHALEHSAMDRAPGDRSAGRVDPMLATALVASVADPMTFRSGRNFSARIGLSPEQYSSGARIGSAASANRLIVICAACLWQVLSRQSARQRSTKLGIGPGSRRY